jgi:hypothetical protein
MVVENNSADVTNALVTVLSEVLHGPSAEAAFLLNRGDRGLINSLGAVTGEMASARPAGRSSIAAHIDHLRYGLELLNRWAQGENPWADANFAASWTRQQVNEDQWQALQKALASEARRWLEALKQPRTWDTSTLTEAMASVAHLAYHLGAIRQLAQPASGPRAAD